jgi:hypothetical protein
MIAGMDFIFDQKVKEEVNPMSYRYVSKDY